MDVVKSFDIAKVRLGWRHSRVVAPWYRDNPVAAK
eukprot:COSAG06_NODE_63427_length_262_cov_0.650307_1_plen_34_part_10